MTTQQNYKSEIAIIDSQIKNFQIVIKLIEKKTTDLSTQFLIASKFLSDSMNNLRKTLLSKRNRNPYAVKAFYVLDSTELSAFRLLQFLPDSPNEKNKSSISFDEAKFFIEALILKRLKEAKALLSGEYSKKNAVKRK